MARLNEVGVRLNLVPPRLNLVPPRLNLVPVRLSPARAGFNRRPGTLIGRNRRRSGWSREANSRLLSAGERAATAGSFERDLRTGEIEFSSGVYCILGAPDGLRLTGDAVLARVLYDDRGLWEAAIATAPRPGDPFSAELRARRFDGEVRTIRVRGMTVGGPDEEPTQLIGTIQDVTDETRERAARDLLSYVVNSSGDAIVTIDDAGKITSWNRAAERLYGYGADEAIGSAGDVVEPPHRAGEQKELLGRVFSGESIDHFETQRLRKDGTLMTVALTVSPVSDDDGTIVSAALTARDVTARVSYEQRLKHLADHDQLTGLYNRHRFDEELTRELARAARSGAGGALICLDVDDFKSINDSRGHTTGDAVLVNVASILRGRLRSTDVVARLGGDEFAALLSGTGAAEARTAAEELRQTLAAAPLVIDGKPCRITVSVGVAPFEGDEIARDELLIHGDLAMHAAKGAGRNRVVTYSPEQGRAARTAVRESWSDRIRQALETDAFVLHLQPIIDLSTGRISHGELLLRMRDADGQLIAPGSFLPTAERVGLIHQIDRWVVEHAIGLIARRSHLELPPVSVNLSGDTVVGDRDMLKLIERELARTNADPSRLIFEITETAAIANMPDALSFTRALISMGCSLALDDFGTGFASFNYLKHLPVRFVKLDGEFIQNLPRSKIDEHVVRTIAALAKSLGIKTVAEAVTDDETIRLLRAHAVDFAQGFHLGKPAPLPEAA